MSSNESRFLICFGLLLAAASLPRFCLSASEWSYDDHHGESGPSHWKKKYSECGMNKQSPIDIRTSVSKYSEMDDLEFNGYNSQISNSYTLINNGHTIQLSVKNDDMRITKGGLSGEYKLVQFHIHWGSTNSQGSEHTVNGRSFPMEIHLVHYNEKYGNISEAISKPDGLAVVGIFAEIGDKSHPVIEKLVEKFNSVKYAGQNTTNVSVFRMIELLPPVRDLFFRYPGSLTTPGCQESVTWTVFKKPIKISQTQINAFRALNHYPKDYNKNASLVDNFRPVQPLGARVVLTNRELRADDDDKHVPDAVLNTGVLASPTPSVSLFALVAAMLAGNLFRQIKQNGCL